MKTVKVTTDNKVSIIDVDFSDFKSIQQAIGGSFETVHTQLMADYFKNPSVIMLVDEEGLVKGLSENALGCALYGTAKAWLSYCWGLDFWYCGGRRHCRSWKPEAMIERLIGTFIGLKRV